MQKPLAIIGPQGSGKTRLIDSIIALYKKDVTYIEWTKLVCGVDHPTFSALTSKDLLVVNVYGKSDLIDATNYMAGVKNATGEDITIIFHCQSEDIIPLSNVNTYYPEYHKFPKRDD